MAKINIDIKSGNIRDDKQHIIGIDLGTSYSLSAYMDGKKAYIIKDKNDQSKLVPSIIHFLSEKTILVGNEAKCHANKDAKRTITSIKRLMGKSFDDLLDYESKLTYKIIDSTDENKLVKIKIDDTFYTPIELSALILKRLKESAESELQVEVNKVVITVPAYFNDTQRQATRDAGKLAGLDVLRIINEPTAASLAYGIGKKNNEAEKVAVYDFGGGTFDVSILHIEDGVFEVLATHGNNFLGGDDFDHQILDFWVDNSIEIKDLIQSNKQVLLDLKILAEEAKISLSNKNIFSKTYKGCSLDISLKQFEELISPLIDKTITSCKKAIKDANLSISEIDKTIMVGGSTRVPLVKKMVSDYFEKPVYDKINPDEVVALGAAIQADILAGNNPDLLLLDISPLSLGIETVGGLMDVIIPRNTKIPARFARNYTTSVDGQVNLRVTIYQGERDLIKDNRKLAEFILRNIPPMQANMPKIEIQFLLDVDGILTVKAKELRSNIETQIEIKSAYGISEEDMGRMLVDSIKNAKKDIATKALLEAKNEGNHVILSTTKFLKQNISLLSQTESDKIKLLSDNIKSAIQDDDKDGINAALLSLNEYSQPLAHRVMDHVIGNALKGTKL